MRISNDRKKVIVSAIIKGVLSFLWSKLTEHKENESEKEKTERK